MVYWAALKGADGFSAAGEGVPGRVPEGEVDFGNPVQIGLDVLLDGGAIILPTVRIGSDAAIGAGSVVTRNIPEAVAAAGNLYRVIRERRK